MLKTTLTGIAAAMSNVSAVQPVPSYHRHSVNHNKPGRPGDKLRKKVAKGHLTMCHPGGLVSETFRDKQKERHKREA